MNSENIGRLIWSLRREKNMTQKQLAERMNISDKTVSKWERGMGCPDISLLNTLSCILDVNIDVLLEGRIEQRSKVGGNMKKIKFYQCTFCGNIITSTAGADISCCGRKLLPMEAHKADEAHGIHIENVDDEYYVTFQHEMTKTHFITFIAHANYDRVLLVKLYPEQSGELRMPRLKSGRWYVGCNQHGLWYI